MRNALQRIIESTVPEHLGLAYDRCAPLDPQTGKISDDKRKDWLRRVGSVNIASDYQFAYERWAASLKTEDTILAEVEMAARLLVGHGNPSPTEVGLTVHHTWGVPIIPGSALKGLVSHYVETHYGPHMSDTHPMDPDFPVEERDRAPFQGVTREGNRILHGPGESFRAMFGAPAAKSD